MILPLCREGIFCMENVDQDKNDCRKDIASFRMQWFLLAEDFVCFVQDRINTNEVGIEILKGAQINT